MLVHKWNSKGRYGQTRTVIVFGDENEIAGQQGAIHAAGWNKCTLYKKGSQNPSN